MSLPFIVAATLSLRTPRRGFIGGGLLAAGSASAAELPFDPIGAYSMGGGVGQSIGAVQKNFNGKPNTGMLLLREVFDGGLPDGGLLAWYEEHLAPDFSASFAGGKVVLDKAAFLSVTADLLKSFPDFTYTRTDAMMYGDPRPLAVTWTAVVKGTHTGAPYSPLPGVPTVAAKNPPIACQNDAEKITLVFSSGSQLSQIRKIAVEALPGGKGFSGPVGFYLQAGGDPSKLP